MEHWQVVFKGGDPGKFLHQMKFYFMWSPAAPRTVHLPKEDQEMLKKFAAMMKDEKGQALAEYGLILALIAVVCVGALTLLGTNLQGILNSIAGSV
jgi:pilus assembly protein Flp/PilA